MELYITLKGKKDPIIFKGDRIDILDFGLILGRMLLKTIDKGENVYKAMKLRNYNNTYYICNNKKINYKDILYLIFWATMFVMI